jgi:ABC-2 type transport system ATP-binding protein
VTAPLIEFDGLTKVYGDRPAVDGLTLTVPEGVVCGLLGPNGAGKTTAMRCLLGLAPVTSGRCAVLGQTPEDYGFREAMHQVGTLIEQPALYRNATGRQNLEIRAAALGIWPDDPRLDEYLAFVGLAERADEKAKGYSLGMKQRLALALAICGGPKLVVLDEPTNGLDPSGITEIRDLIKSLPSMGTTVLVSSHLLAEVEVMCDYVAILQSGRLIESAPMADLLGGGEQRFTVVCDDLERAADVLRADGFEVTSRDGELSVLGAQVGSDIARTLVNAGIYPDELTRHELHLEELFLSITEPGEL